MSKVLTRSAALLALALGCGPASADQPLKWALRLHGDAVQFQGQSNMDDANLAAGGMMYPAPNAAGLVAAILTHGALVGAARDSRKAELQQKANEVLAPVREFLAGFGWQELVQRAGPQSVFGHPRMASAGAPAEQEWLVETRPVFTMTQDRSALILDNQVAIFKPGSTGQPSYQNTVRVVSRTHDHPDLGAYWSGSQASVLKAESAQLMAMSLDIALRDASASSADKQRAFSTVRYTEGKTPMFERAQVLEERCGRSLVRNLRGWLMSLPLIRRSAQPEAECAPAPAATQ